MGFDSGGTVAFLAGTEAAGRGLAASGVGCVTAGGGEGEG